MRIVLVRKQGALRPADDDADTFIRKLAEGEIVAADIKRPRNLAHHRKFWKLMQVVYENQSVYASPEHVCTAFKMACGYYETYQTKNGPVGVPRSISFAKMDQSQFEEFYDRAVDFLTTEVIPGLGRDELEREVTELLK